MKGCTYILPIRRKFSSANEVAEIAEYGGTFRFVLVLVLVLVVVVVDGL